MPDMGHSIAYEANVINDYYYNTWDAQSAKSLDELSRHNQPVAGTIPRGYAGVVNASGKDFDAKMAELKGETSVNAVAVPLNGKAPYYLPNTNEGYEASKTDVTLAMNPFPISEDGLARGKDLYNIYCGICHGEKGDGNGWLARDDSPYNAAPTSYLTDELIDAQNGRYYHVIMHGKGVMGSYADKLSYEERWQVIHYIRSLQAKQREAKYDQFSNTLNTSATPYTDTPGGVDMYGSLAKNFRELALKNGVKAGHAATHGDSHGEDDHADNDHGDDDHGDDDHGDDDHGDDDHGHGHAHDSEVAKLKGTLRLDNVTFETGSANLDPSSKLELNTLAKLMSIYSTVNIELGGHTDNVGDDGGNMALSDARAQAVMAYLATRGVNASRMTAKGYGETKPVANNATEDGRAKNRRTEVVLH
jgi:outer membrane protein OmpA-like peptidoglycan-associated protein